MNHLSRRTKEDAAKFQWCTQSVSDRWKAKKEERGLGFPIRKKKNLYMYANPKGNQSWIFIGKTDAEAEAPILWPPDKKNWLIRKDPDAGKDWRQEEKRMTENEMAGYHHWLDGHEFEQAWGAGDGQGSLVCCRPWGSKEWDAAEQLNWYMCAYVCMYEIYGMKKCIISIRGTDQWKISLHTSRQGLIQHSYRLRHPTPYFIRWESWGSGGSYGPCIHPSLWLYGHANFPQSIYQTPPAVVEQRDEDITCPKVSMI